MQLNALHSVFPHVHLVSVASLCSCARVLFLFCIYLSEFPVGTMRTKKSSAKESGEKRMMSMDFVGWNGLMAFTLISMVKFSVRRAKGCELGHGTN